jgi:hypothetical protein
MRLSLVGTSERYEKGVLEVYELLKNGKSKLEIINELSTNYPEREIEALLRRIDELKSLKPYTELKLALKVLLWVFLILKIFSSIIILSESQFSTITGIFILLIVPLLNIVALYLVYKEDPTSYTIIFVFVLLSFSNVIDSIKLAVTSQFIIEIVFSSINVILIISLLVIVFVLKKKNPIDLLDIKKIFEKHSLDYSNI